METSKCFVRNARPNINNDDTQLRNSLQPDRVSDCKFCYASIKDRIVEDLGTVSAIVDRYPVTDGHHLIIPKRHAEDWFSMNEEERRDADSLISIITRRLSAFDKTITGFNVGMNCGKSAGQTIFHAHIHLIPRRDGDTPDPVGGVRGVIPDKMRYK